MVGKTGTTGAVDTDVSCVSVLRVIGGVFIIGTNIERIRRHFSFLSKKVEENIKLLE